jgi:squalene-associated FAD-dependent desaturase
MKPDAIVIGGGCAGFAAATALTEAGARVLVLEARPGLGGRATAFTDPASGERVDNGQHILMGCYTETLKFLGRIGAADRVRWQSGLKVSMIDRAGHHSVLSLPALPSPLHFLAGVLTWEALNWSERLSVLRIGSMIKPGSTNPANEASNNPAKAGCSRNLGISVRAWLEKNGQAPRLCELFWEPLALAALNQSIDQAEASHFIRVLERVFGPDPAAAALVMPAVPLDELYAEPAREWLQQRGGEVRVNAPAKVIVDGGSVKGARVREEMIDAPIVISTVPWHAFHQLFDHVPAGLEQTVANATKLASLPIVTVNLWFDDAVMNEPLVGLPGRNFQWIFDRRAIVGGDASHLSLISSGAETIVRQTNDELTATALREVKEALPAARSVKLHRGAGKALDILARARRAASSANQDRDRWPVARRRLD